MLLLVSGVMTKILDLSLQVAKFQVEVFALHATRDEIWPNYRVDKPPTGSGVGMIKIVEPLRGKNRN